jgi:hypothetical protein
MGKTTKLTPPEGATVTKDRRDGCYRADSPPGKIWNASDAHQIVRDYTDVTGRPYRGSTEAARRRLQEDMDGGLRACDVPDCDVCAEEFPGQERCTDPACPVPAQPHRHMKEEITP